MDKPTLNALIMATIFLTLEILYIIFYEANSTLFGFYILLSGFAYFISILVTLIVMKIKPKIPEPEPII